MNKKIEVLVKLSPLLVPFIFIFSLGIIITILQSFGLFVFNYKYSDFLFAYKKLFSNTWFLKSFLFSLYVSFSSSLLAISLGTLLSYSIWKLPQSLQKYTILYKIPLILPHIVVAYIIILLFSASGIISSLLYNLKVIKSIEEFPKILHSGNGLDIISGYIIKETSFAILMIISVLNRIDKKLLDSAKMLGAGRIKIFFKIVFPFIFPIITTTFIMLFIYSFGGFEIPFVLGDSYPGMLSVRVFDLFFRRDLTERPTAMAMLTIIFFFSLIFIYIYSKIISKISIFERKV